MDCSLANSEYKIVVFGVGNIAVGILDHIISASITGVNFVAVDTKSGALEESLASQKILIDSEDGVLSHDIQEVHHAVIKNIELFKAATRKSYMVIIVAHVGEVTASVAAPVIARAVLELGVWPIGVIARPSLFEGKKRRRRAQESIAKLDELLDNLTILNSDGIEPLYIVPRTTVHVDPFIRLTEMTFSAVQGIVGHYHKALASTEWRRQRSKARWTTPERVPDKKLL